MNKLLNAFRADPSDANRTKLAKYLAKHMMASMMCTGEEITFLRANGFNV